MMPSLGNATPLLRSRSVPADGREWPGLVLDVVFSCLFQTDHLCCWELIQAAVVFVLPGVSLLSGPRHRRRPLVRVPARLVPADLGHTIGGGRWRSKPREVRNRLTAPLYIRTLTCRYICGRDLGRFLRLQSPLAARHHPGSFKGSIYPANHAVEAVLSCSFLSRTLQISPQSLPAWLASLSGCLAFAWLPCHLTRPLGFPSTTKSR